MNSIENCNRPAGPVMIDGDNLTLRPLLSVTRRHRGEATPSPNGLRPLPLESLSRKNGLWNYHWFPPLF